MIGILKEKSMHQYLKNYFEPIQENQEVKIGPYYADIFNGNEIIEIQTQNLNKLREKVTYYLNDYNVRIVYPISHIKYINLTDENGEVKRRKSPKVGTIYDSIKELYKLKPILRHDNLRLTFVLIDVEEFRIVNNKSKKHFTKIENIPVKIEKVININSIDEYLVFLDGIDNKFTSADLNKKKRIPKEKASLLLGILNKLGIIEIVGKQGRYYVYSKLK